MSGAVSSFPRRTRRAGDDAIGHAVENVTGPLPLSHAERYDAYIASIPGYVSDPRTPIARLYDERLAVERSLANIEKVPGASRNWEAHAAGLRVRSVLDREIARRGG